MSYRFCELLLTATFVMASLTLSAQPPQTSGEQRIWHRTTLTFDGPTTSEKATLNPFADYALDVTFTNGDQEFVVPGYYAADGNAAETSSTQGNKWRVNFAPNRTGTWEWTASFTTGTDVAVDGGGTSAAFMDGATGSFFIAESDKNGRDHRGKGRLEYVGEHYLRYAGSGEWFVKAGADAPENTLAYEDFDEVPNFGNGRKNWQPHQQDFVAAEAAEYTWQNGKGSELLGVVNYLSTVGVNAFSFLTFNTAGDDKNVYPHLYKGDFSAEGGEVTWNEIFHDRFDISRLAQWERVFSYADQKGVYLHFKTQETENDDLMDGGDVGRERKLYYRELIARFGHHLALNWNMGEENKQSSQQRIEMAAYFAAIDPYNHLRVIHTYPAQKNSVYTSLLGSNSAYTGVSLQTANSGQTENYGDTFDWVDRSKSNGKKWVVAVDEPGSANIGVDTDPRARKLTRHRVVWANLMAGGGGTEFYYGYESGCGDLNCQDHRSRGEKYADAALALKFFQVHFQPYLPDVSRDNDVTDDNDDYVLTNPGFAYAIYRPDGGSTSISLPDGAWTVQWYNPRNGEMNTPSSITPGTLVAPDTEDWVALIVQSSALPVEWLSFTARAERKSVRLDWSVAKEENNQRFIVEHMGADAGAKFSWIADLPPSTSPGEHSFEFIHKTPASGSNSYRIVQEDTDGSKNFSPVRTVTFAGVSVAISPNPFTDSVRLSYPGSLNRLRVYDTNGRVVYSHSTTATDGVDLNLSALPAGVYWLKGELNGTEWESRIVKR
ncbi:DUF5060 domain-containing protein [Neolewinella antarctica]|uniref:DUF5060 domain-containing protein n=1 Tax=Neolewinella antarctica TaxID=442734 RepID=A0ABX0XC70_9BACT|nr:DUF5060 domain-containing protein [Neolewinella antarctica]NJC26533.1 hypothetical protein [Neolewinella antarctica]